MKISEKNCTAAAAEDRMRAKARLVLACMQRDRGDLAGARLSIRVALFWRKAEVDDRRLAILNGEATP